MPFHNSFIGYLFSRKKIAWTLAINFVAGAYYYISFEYGIESFSVSNVWIAIITIFITSILFIYWFTSYREFKKQPIGK